MEVPNPNAAPSDLEIVRNFVNTRDIETRHDRFATPAGLMSWLRENDLVDPDDADPGASEGRQLLARAIELREGLRYALAAHEGEPDGKRHLRRLNKAAQGLSLQIQFEPGGPRVAPIGAGPAAGLARLMGIVHAAAVDGSWERLRICASDDCRWAFYDHSRNASGKWCAMAICGNRDKARRYRRRQAA
jgi:predicted RNA-binding Zn ribbon-like protein